MQFEQVAEFILNKMQRELPAHLTYHDVEHTRDVVNAAKQLAQLENVNAGDTQLLLTAAMYHDAGHIVKSEGHEEESCLIAGRTLPNYGYTPAQIEQICGIIRATRLPQSPANHLEQIIADADLDYLGRDDFFAISHKLYLELAHTGAVTNENEWNKKQIDFLENHRYFTKTAINLRQAKKEQNIEQIKSQNSNLAE
ncbi:hypothetical protein GCM10023149_19120 [Mucilaginibacter gynuensis]|uniref:HD/PDEase domain-containing protein n=1 Tax=Mucilaginibacter gynuensis TaxID=1302236 RepID=A0ABP8GA38_9SPHI